MNTIINVVVNKIKSYFICSDNNMVGVEKNNLIYNRAVGFSIVGIALVVLVSLLLPWQIEGESWGYWYSSKILLEGGGFVNAARSPLYTTYLLPYFSLPYPLSTQTENYFTTLFSTVAIFIFLRQIMGVYGAILFSILWIPHIQQNSPSIHAIGLGCISIAFALRFSSAKCTPKKLSVSYALLILAIIFRQNYAVFFVLVVVYDFIRISFDSKAGGINLIITGFKPLLSGYTLFLVALLVIFSLFQSSHRWNNVWLTSADWFPGDVQSLGMTSINVHYNARYVMQKYGSHKNTDIYFTNEEAFSGATTVIGMIKTNPMLFFDAMTDNLKAFPVVALYGLQIPTVSNSILRKFIYIFLFIGLIYGAVRAPPNSITMLYVLACLTTAFVTALYYPKTRYMFTLLPIYALSAWWWGKRLEMLILKIKSTRISIPISKLALPLIILIFSSANILKWTELNILKDNQVYTKHEKISERNLSMVDAYQDLSVYVRGCKGLMTYEHTYFYAFLANTNTTQVYDLHEIPPFGKYGDSEYSRLKVENIDCLFISYGMEDYIGMVANNQIRYKNFIKPYEDYLLSIGAKSYAIPDYGRVTKIVN